MTSCTIIISHYRSFQFLRACLRQINRHQHQEIKLNIIVADQSGSEYYSDDIEKFRTDISELGNSSEVIFYNMIPLYSGFGIDWLMRYADIKTDYICQLHADAFPINKNWLYLPVKLIEENNFSFVGQHQFVCDGTQSIYPPDPFFAMSQCFNVARTETYRDMSMEAGFTRFHEREKTDLRFNNNDWAQWASHDYPSRGSDDDVVAFHWEDKYRQHDKLGLAITGMMNTSEQGGSFGRVIEDVVFHFGSANESRGVFDLMPNSYQHYYNRIQNGFTNELLEEMLIQVKPNNFNRVLWKGDLKEAYSASEDLNYKIEELKSI